MIKVLIVEDTMVYRELLKEGLSKDPEIKIVAAVGDAYAARDAIIEYKPDVMTLDVELPRMSGLEFLRKLMPQYPMPVVVISAMSNKVFDMLEAGAVDFVNKPLTTDHRKIQKFIRHELTEKIKVAAVAQIKNTHICKTVQKEIVHVNSNILIAIGASTGGTEATTQVLQELDANTPGIVLVQHMPEGFTKMYAERLDRVCKVRVREAVSGDIIRPGQVLLAPAGKKQMKVIRTSGEMRVVLNEEGKVSGHCPSVDVLFDSVAKVAGKNALGVILTGMGADGAKGMLNMRNMGARTIGQDESTCVVYGMPKVAYDIGAVEYQEKIFNVASRMKSILKQM